MAETAIISVQGKGAIHVVPDVMRIEVVVKSVFPDYQQAYSQAKDNSGWMVKILEYNNKPGKLAKAIRFDISDHIVPVYDDNGNIIDHKKQGFDLVQCIKVDLPIDNILANCIVKGVGKFIPGAQINIGYTLQDPRPCQLKMLARAVSDAKEKATLMAEAAGCKLGAVVKIDYCHQDIHTYSQARNIHSNSEAKASTADSLDISPADLVISDTVDVQFGIINPGPDCYSIYGETATACLKKL